MPDDDGIRVSRSVTIPSSEIQMSFSPSGGPGGQHANKTSTRAELLWNVDESNALTKRQKQRVRSQLRGRIDARGILHLTSDEHRSQTRNRAEVERRLAKLVALALIPPKARVATRPSKGSVERRIQEKKRRSDVKKQRRRPDL
jgi:ribosome-associated protein